MRRLLLMLTVAAAATPAAAHAPFLRPLNFSPSRPTVTVIGGMHEETVFVSDFALRPGDFWVVGPDGSRTRLEKQASLSGLSAVDVSLPAPGTYRITTGDRVGREAVFAKVDGSWRLVRGQGQGPVRGGGAVEPGRRGASPGEARPPARREERPPPLDAADVPAGAPTVRTTGILKAETYVTRGAPTFAALKASGEGFELEPITNPTEVFLDGGFTFRLLRDGAPAPGVTVHVRRGDEQYADTKTDLVVDTDAQGRATARFPRQGVYILEALDGAPASPGAAPAPRTTALSVSLEVTP